MFKPRVSRAAMASWVAIWMRDCVLANWFRRTDGDLTHRSTIALCSEL